MTVTADDIYAMAPYARTLGVRFTTLSAEGVDAELDFVPELSTAGGGLHGGALMGLADVASAVCAALNGPAGAVPATTTSTTHFLRPVREGAAYAKARVLRVGRDTAVVECDIEDDGHRLCTRVTQTVSIRVPRG
ncbi:PaaI family thioesterase [Streptomyces sp. NPDC005070]